MKAKDIFGMVAKLGGVVVANTVPGGSALIAEINKYLPTEKKLPSSATGNDVNTAIDHLSPDQKSSLFEKEIDLEIKREETWRDIQESLNNADEKGASTRPFIAKMMAWAVVLTVVPLAWAIIFALFASKPELITSISNLAPLVLTLIGTPILLLRSYFGMRTKEKNSRVAGATGQSVAPMAALISSVLKR